MNQPSKAIESFKKVIEIDSESADAYNNLAWLYADLQMNLDQAVGLAKKAVELAPTSSNFDTLAYVYYQHNQYPQAEEAIKRAIKISPSNQKYNEMLKKFTVGSQKEPTSDNKRIDQTTDNNHTLCFTFFFILFDLLLPPV